MNRYPAILLLVSAGFSLAGFAQTYTTHFEGTENPLSENGRWANHGLDWTQIRKKDGVASGTQAGTNTGIYKFDDSYAHLSGFPPDQEAWGQAHISKLKAPCIQELEILLRWASSAHRTTGYECFARCVNDTSSYVQVVRWDGPLGKFTYLADHRGTNYGLKDGDILKASIVSNVITVCINGVEKARVTDNTFASGDPGIGEFLACEGARGVGSNPDFGFSSFTARAIGGTNANAGSDPRPVLEAEQTDRHGGMMRVNGDATGGFHVQQVGSAWWLVTPEGHGIFARAVSKVDVADYGGSGGFRSYDAVYLQSAGGGRSANLAEAAADTATRDVVLPGAGVTLRAKDDAIYIGSVRFRPNHTYFWLDQPGGGGRMTWAYSTADGWKPIGPAGQPWKGAALNPDGSCSLEVGNYMAPDADGFGTWDNKNANRLTWWDMAVGCPADFVPVSLAGDPTPRYYLRGTVTEDFATAPIVNQIYERAELAEEVARKYGPGDWPLKWAGAITERLKGWGFNAAGMYSGRYGTAAPRLTNRLAIEPTWQLSGWAVDPQRPWHVKSVYAGAVFPPGSGRQIWQGIQADVFDPAFEQAYLALVKEQPSPQDPWSWALIPEEADYLFGMDSRTHDHLGYVVLSQNPWRGRAAAAGVAYTDPRFHAKYALRDFLRDRYRAKDDRSARFTERSVVPAFAYARAPSGAEQAALQALNAAWGTHYTTWDTSAGDLPDGTNAYGTGTGFMDENGKGILTSNVRGVGFGQAFTDSTHPAIRKDLDDYLGVFAARYGRILAQAVNQVAHPPLLLPLYDAPGPVYRAIAPYVDAFWVNVPKPEDALRIYNASHRPLVVADYLTADPDSQLFFRGTVETIRYDAAREATVITAPDLRYPFRMARFVTFPEAEELNRTGQCGGKWVYAFPRIKSLHGHSLEVPGDFTGCVRPGQHLERWKEGGFPLKTQAGRARAMIARWNSLLDLRGDDGLRFVIGFEHWCLYDPSVSNWFDFDNFGLATFNDNAYDGTEARRAPGRDARGCPIGGEESDYGDLLGPVGEYLRGVDARLAGR